jgi:transcriptional regulator with XRE-family HTH domain
MELKDVLATNVRLLRQKIGITQEELAERTGVSSRYVGSIERARVSASVTVLGKLAKAFDVDPCKLITHRPTVQ